MSSNHSKKRARQLRRDMTGPERVLWQAIRNRQLAGLKFRRQHSIGPFIADFACESLKLVVELDGDSHIDQYEHDRRRQDYLVEQGYRVFRVDNDDVLKELETVLEGILLASGIALE